MASNQDEVKSYITIIKDAKKELPNLILPSMGIDRNDNKIDIDVKDYFVRNSQKEKNDE